jgi:hypothetical protein
VKVLALMRTLRAHAPTRVFLNLMVNLPDVRKEMNKMREVTQVKTLESLEQEAERKALMRYAKPFSFIV